MAGAAATAILFWGGGVGVRPITKKDGVNAPPGGP